jgi:glutamate racemase
VVEPGAQSAAAATRNRTAVVIGTEATITSHAYQRALSARGLTVREKACPLFVPLVEEGWVEHPVTEQVARIYLDEAFADGFSKSDVLLLGCTHYPLLKPLLHRVAPPGVTIVDSAESTAHAVAQKLGAKNSKLETGNSRLHFFATDSVEKFRRSGERFLGCRIEDVKHVDIEGSN